VAEQPLLGWQANATDRRGHHNGPFRARSGLVQGGSGARNTENTESVFSMFFGVSVRVFGVSVHVFGVFRCLCPCFRLAWDLFPKPYISSSGCTFGQGTGHAHGHNNVNRCVEDGSESATDLCRMAWVTEAILLWLARWFNRSVKDGLGWIGWPTPIGMGWVGWPRRSAYDGVGDPADLYRLCWVATPMRIGRVWRPSRCVEDGLEGAADRSRMAWVTEPMQRASCSGFPLLDPSQAKS
jgi:hypothetical protein